MIGALKLLAWFVVSLFTSKGRLEIVILRHQLNVPRRRIPARARLTLIDRLILVWLYRLRPSVLNAVTIVKPYIPHVEDAIWHEFSGYSGGRNARSGTPSSVSS